MFFGFLGSSPKRTVSSPPPFNSSSPSSSFVDSNSPSQRYSLSPRNSSVPITISSQEEELLDQVSLSSSSSSSSSHSRKQSLTQSLAGLGLFHREHNLMYAIEKGDSNLVLQKLSKNEEKPTFEHWKAAIRSGNLRVVSIMMEEGGMDPSMEKNWAIKESSSLGEVEIVEKLLKDKRVDPSDGSSWAEKNEPLKGAARGGHANVVKMLLAHCKVNPTVDGCLAMREAASKGHCEVVKVLLADKRIDPCQSGNFSWEERNEVLRNAKEGGHRNIVELLLKDDRIVKQEEERKTCSEQANATLSKSDDPFASPNRRNWSF